MEWTRNVQGCYVAKSKTQQMCRSQGSNGQLEGLEQSHGSSLEPLDNHFQSHGLINETRKVSKLENKICHDFNPQRSMDGSMRSNDPCRLGEKFTNSASCAGAKPHGSGSQNCRIWTCDQWLPHFLGISDGDIPVMVRRNSNSDTRTNWFASLNTRDEHVFGITSTDYQWATRPRTNRALRKNPSFGGARAYKLCKTFKKDGLNTRNIGILATKTAISKLPVVDQLRIMQVCRAHVKKKHWQLDDVKRLLPGRFQMLPQVHPNNRKKKLVGGFNLPLWKMMEFVNGKDYISHIWNGK